jgi:hypothetical protein
MLLLIHSKIKRESIKTVKRYSRLTDLCEKCQENNANNVFNYSICETQSKLACIEISVADISFNEIKILIRQLKNPIHSSVVRTS